MQEASTLWSWSSAKSTQHTLQLPDFLQASSILMCTTMERHEATSQPCCPVILLMSVYTLLL